MAGDSAGLGLAHGAITTVGKLNSVRTRKQLSPLADALDARRATDARKLARHARWVSAVPV